MMGGREGQEGEGLPIPVQSGLLLYPYCSAAHRLSQGFRGRVLLLSCVWMGMCVGMCRSMTVNDTPMTPP